MNEKHEINLWKLRTDLDGKCLQNGLVDKGHENRKQLKTQKQESMSYGYILWFHILSTLVFSCQYFYFEA